MACGVTTVTLNAAIDRLLRIDRLREHSVQRATEVRATPGGKGLNVARIANQLGANVTTTGFLAGHAGAFIEERLRDEGIAASFIRVPGESRQCLNLVDDRGGSTEILEPGITVSADDIARLRARLRQLATNADVVVISGSLPRGCPPDLYAQLIADVRAAGSRAFLDSSGESLRRGLGAAPHFVKPNAEEAAALVGRGIDSPTEAASAAQQLRANYGVELAVISLGPQGAVLSCAEGNWWALPPAVPVVNAVGCGDAFVGAFATAYATSGSARESLAVAVEVSSAAALSATTGRFEPTDLLRIRERGITVEEIVTN